MAQGIDLNKIITALTGGLQPIGKGPAGRRAAAEAQLRYLPALQSLGLLGNQTMGQYQQDVRGVRRSGAAAASGIGAVRGQFLSQLDATPAPTGEAAAALGLTRDAVAGELAKMQAQQHAGVTSGLSRLRSKRNSDLESIVGQLMQTSDQARLFNISQYEALAQDRREAARAARQWSQGQRNSLVSAGINPDTGVYDPSLNPPEKPAADPVNAYGVRKSVWESMTPDQRARRVREWKRKTSIDGGGQDTAKLPGGVDLNTNQQHERFGGTVGQVKTWASRLKGDMSRSEIAQVLLTGAESSGGSKIPQIKSELAVRVGLDMALLGYVSNGTAKRLHAAGYSVRKLGLPGAAGAGTGTNWSGWK